MNEGCSIPPSARMECLLPITGLCNSNCSFCDRALPSEHFSRQQINRSIEEAHAAGCTKIALSGGEPTIHPDFLDIVSCARQAGHEVSVLTNGRMFSYSSFAEKAKEHGLTHAVISIHSHMQDVHDMQSRVKDFLQRERGIRNCLAAGIRTVVSIAITAHNIIALKETLRHFRDQGVGEFRLHHIREKATHMAIDPEKELLNLFDALMFCRNNSIKVDADLPGARVLALFPEFDRNRSERGEAPLGKAVDLRWLQAKGFRVPPFNIVGSEVLTAYLAHHGLVDKKPEEIHDYLLKIEMPGELMRQIQGPADCERYIVRSAYEKEDGIGTSFAGVLDSVKDVDRKGLEPAVRQVWASLFTGRSVAYHNRKGLLISPSEMSVIIQEMVPGKPYTAQTSYMHPMLALIESHDGIREIVHKSDAPDDKKLKKMLVESMLAEALQGRPSIIEFVLGSEVFMVQSRPAGKDTEKILLDKVHPSDADDILLFADEIASCLAKAGIPVSRQDYTILSGKYILLDRPAVDRASAEKIDFESLQSLLGRLQNETIPQLGETNESILAFKRYNAHFIAFDYLLSSVLEHYIRSAMSCLGLSKRDILCSISPPLSPAGRLMLEKIEALLRGESPGEDPFGFGKELGKHSRTELLQKKKSLLANLMSNGQMDMTRKSHPLISRIEGLMTIKSEIDFSDQVIKERLRASLRDPALVRVPFSILKNSGPQGAKHAILRKDISYACTLPDPIPMNIRETICGRAVIVRSKQDVARVDKSIMIVEDLSPYLIEALPKCMAIIAKRGELIGHVMLVAKEFQIPSVVGVGNLYDWIRDNDIIRITEEGKVTK